MQETLLNRSFSAVGKKFPDGNWSCFMQDTYFHTDLSSIFRAETKLNWFRKHVV